MRKVQRKLTQLVKDINARKFKYKDREEKPVDWFAYTIAQVNEISDYLTLVRNIVDEIEYSIGNISSNIGRPSKSAYNKAKAILLQEFFQVSNRVAEGLVKLFKEKLGITEHLTYKDIERAYEDGEVVSILKIVMEMTNEPVAAKETDFSIDGSGMPRTIKSNYANDRNDTKQLSKYDKFIGVIGYNYKLYSAFAITEGEANESPFLIPLLEVTRKLFYRIGTISGDAAFLSRINCNYIASIGAIPRIFPKGNTVINAKGSMAWKRMLLEFVDYTQKWLREYHTRSISETGNSVLKNRFPRPLLKRIESRRYVESFAKICCYNLRRLVYVRYLNGIEVRWLAG